MADTELRTRLDAIEPHIQEMDCFVVPSTFDPDDVELRAFPIPNSWKWSSCEEMLKAFKSRVVMMRLPLFWQLEPALYEACQAAHATIFINEPENMPMGAEAIRQGEVDTIVTTAADAAAFSAYLLEKKLHSSCNWIIVHRAEEAWNIPAILQIADTRVAQEVHLLPGAVALYQCPALAEAKTAAFHICEYTNPLVPLEIPFELTSREKCSCGETVYGRSK